MKAEDYIAGLLNDDQMLTIETTDHAIKIFENCASRAIEPSTTVLLAGASNDDTADMIAMKAEIAELRAFKSTITPAATTGVSHTGKRARVNNKDGKTTVFTISCALCCHRPSFCSCYHGLYFG